MENMEDLAMQQQRISNTSPRDFNEEGCYFQVTQAETENLPLQTGVTVDHMDHSDSLHSVLGPPSIVDKLLYFMERVDARMNGLECKTGEIFGMMKLYETLVYKYGDSTFSPKEVDKADARHGESELAQAMGMNRQKNVATNDQSHKTLDLHTTENTNTPHEKSKHTLDDPNLNLIVPNSDGENDDVFINERLSTPRICTSMNITAADAFSRTEWVSGHKKQVYSLPRTRAANSLAYSAQDTPPEPYPAYSLIGKKLFLTPSPAQRPLKRPRAEGSSTPAFAHDTPENNSHRKRSGRTQPSQVAKKGHKSIPKNPALLLPRNFRTHFKPTPDMDLTKCDCKIAAYLFSMDMDRGEMIFVYRDTRIPRDVFLSLSPGNIVDPQIIDCKVLNTTWMQKNGHMVTTWSLPASFSSEALSGMTTEELMDKYQEAWMPSTCFLQFVYVPFHENTGHWFLMVISLKESRVYALDSNPAEDKIVARRDNMSIVCGALSDMFAVEPFLSDFINEPPNLRKWDIVDARGIPNQGNSHDSAVWVLGWLDMEYAFTNDLSGKLEEPRVRMKTATRLASTPFNQQAKFLQSRADAYWNSIAIA